MDLVGFLNAKLYHYNLLTNGAKLPRYCQQQSLKNLCDECLLPFSPNQLKRCTRCKTVQYCGKQCQTAAWKSHHKVMCNKVKICPVPGKGLGMIAIADIRKGDLILSEKPLIRLTDQNSMSKMNERLLHSLCDKDKRKLMSLYDGEAGDESSDSVHPRLALNVFKTNGQKHVDLFYIISRINHSCAYNASVNATHKGDITNVAAMRDIAKGEEITWNYIKTAHLSSSREERSFLLKQGFLIDACVCHFCSLSGEEYQKDELIRRQIENLNSKLQCCTDARDFYEYNRVKKNLMRDAGFESLDDLLDMTLGCLYVACVMRNRKLIKKYKKEGFEYASILHHPSMFELFDGNGCDPDITKATFERMESSNMLSFH